MYPKPVYCKHLRIDVTHFFFFFFFFFFFTILVIKDQHVTFFDRSKFFHSKNLPLVILKQNSGTLLDFSKKSHLITFLCYPNYLPYQVSITHQFVGSSLFLGTKLMSTERIFRIAVNGLTFLPLILFMILP